jgi:hypothetical protein
MKSTQIGYKRTKEGTEPVTGLGTFVIFWGSTLWNDSSAASDVFELHCFLTLDKVKFVYPITGILHLESLDGRKWLLSLNRKFWMKYSFPMENDPMTENRSLGNGSSVSGGWGNPQTSLGPKFFRQLDQILASFALHLLVNAGNNIWNTLQPLMHELIPQQLRLTKYLLTFTAGISL